MVFSDNLISNLRPNKQRIAGILIATIYVFGIAFVRVFPNAPLSGIQHFVQIGFTALMALGLVVLARFSRYPLLPIVAIALLAVAGIELIIACAQAACLIPPEYEPWRNLKVFFGQGFLGPRLLLSSQPESCGISCPHRIEIVPLILAYVAIWVGAAEPEPW